MAAIIAPPPDDRYGPPRPPGVHPERVGFTADCVCRFVVWKRDEPDAVKALAEHKKKCKGAKK